MARDDSESNLEDRGYESWEAAASAALKGRDLSAQMPNPRKEHLKGRTSPPSSAESS